MIQDLISLNREKYLAVAQKFVKNRDLAEDILSDSILKALEKKHLFDGNNFGGWFYTIIRNNCINALRDKKTFIEIGFDYGKSDNYEIKQELIEAHKILNDIEDNEVKRKRKYDTPNSLILLYAHGYSYDELARKFNIPLGSIKSKIHKDRLELKRRLRA
jgi:RNA polymerase sigma-70 factor (ECF subfamily)